MIDDVFERLAEPFPPERVYFRQGGQGKWLAYADARAYMERLDEVVGPANWSDSYEETQSGRVICTLELRLDPEDNTLRWASKSDGAGDTSFEGEKGAISDAFKRACVKWGTGRYLYALPDFYSEAEGRKHLETLVWSSKQMRTKYWKGLKDAASEDDSGKARELWDELDNDQRMDIWRDYSSAVRSTIKHLLQSTGADDAL